MSNLIAMRGNLVALRGNLVQLDARKMFIIEVDTTKGNGFNTFTLPLTNHFTDVYVETSDGQRFTITNYLDVNKTITFPSAGKYIIKIKGECGWSFNNIGDCQKLIKVKNWGNLKFNYLDYGFYGCINLTKLPDAGSINAPAITALQYTFSGCSKLIEIGNNKIFNRCLSVTNFYRTFYNNKLTSIPSNLFDYNTLVTNFYETFSTNQLTSIPSNLFRYNTLVTSFYRTFSTNQLTTIPSNLFDYNTLVTNFYATFYSNKLTTIPVDLFRYNTLVTNFYATFHTNKLTSIPDDLFRYNILLNSISNISYGLFQNNLLTSIPENLFLYNPLITNYANTFANALASGCTMPSVMFDLSKIKIVTSWQNMFNQTSTTNSPLGSVQDIWNYASASSVKTDCFNNCTALINYGDIPLAWT